MNNRLNAVRAQAVPYDKSITVRSLMDSTGLAGFLALPGVTELAVNRPYEVWTEARDGWVRHEAPMCSLDSLNKLANAMVIFNGAGGHLSAENPIHPVRLPDGQRGHVLIAPAVEHDTVSITLRVPSNVRLAMADYNRSGALSAFRDTSPTLEDHMAGLTRNASITSGLTLNDFEDTARVKLVPAEVRLAPFELQMLEAKAQRDMDQFMTLAVANELNIVTVGGTGSGKTTLMKMLADLVPVHKRVATIEDTHELALPFHPNHVHLFFSDTLPAKEIVRSTLRMKFDRVFLAELRGDETWDYLTLLNTGHRGGMTSVHANDSLSTHARIVQLIKASAVGQTLDLDYLTREVKMTIDVVLYMEGKRLKEVFFDPIGKWKLFRGLV